MPGAALEYCSPNILYRYEVFLYPNWFFGILENPKNNHAKDLIYKLLYVQSVTHVQSRNQYAHNLMFLES